VRFVRADQTLDREEVRFVRAVKASVWVHPALLGDGKKELRLDAMQRE
jgi:hypothetical protein